MDDLRKKTPFFEGWNTFSKASILGYHVNFRDVFCCVCVCFFLFGGEEKWGKDWKAVVH